MRIDPCPALAHRFLSCTLDSLVQALSSSFSSCRWRRQTYLLFLLVYNIVYICHFIACCSSVVFLLPVLQCCCIQADKHGKDQVRTNFMLPELAFICLLSHTLSPRQTCFDPSQDCTARRRLSLVNPTVGMYESTSGKRGPVPGRRASSKGSLYAAVATKKFANTTRRHSLESPHLSADRPASNRVRD